jgi:acyl-homoserine-lactone acylase
MKRNLLLSIAYCLFSNILPISVFSQQTLPQIEPADVTIVRDSFGIPHIFGKTDAQVAYGLAWANAEDAFPVIEGLIATGKGFMGRKDGIEGAKSDFFVHAIGAHQLVKEKFENDLSPEFKKYIDGFVQGINAYAKAHPERSNR